MRSFLIIVSFFWMVTAFSQGNLSDKIYYGGGGGFSASSNQVNISVSPFLGYKVTEKYSAGFGIVYQYVKINQPVNSSLSNIGWSVFNRFNITRQFFGYAEFERMRFEYFTSFTPEQTEKSTYNSLLIGAGYSEQLSGRATFSIMALYNVLYDEADPLRPYKSPWIIRAGVGIGIF